MVHLTYLHLHWHMVKEGRYGHRLLSSNCFYLVPYQLYLTSYVKMAPTSLGGLQKDRQWLYGPVSVYQEMVRDSLKMRLNQDLWMG
jgi:hypothetical protein